MRVVVTGAGGFVGRHLARHFAARGDAVFPLAGPTDAVDPAGRRVDVLDFSALRDAVRDFAPDAVVHLAGLSSVAQSHSHPAEAFRVIVLGAVNLCLAVLEAAPKARVLMVGSGEMYGVTAPGRRALETDPLDARSPYAAAKIGAEVAALTFRRSRGLDVIAARPFNHLGRGQRTDFAVPSFARQIDGIAGGNAAPVIRVGNLGAIRDFSHVDDVVAAYRLLIEKGESGAAYNVCSGDGHTMRSVLDQLLSLARVDARVEVDPARVRPVDIPELVGDPGKLRDLGWAPRKTLKDALSDALDEARTQRLASQT